MPDITSLCQLAHEAESSFSEVSNDQLAELFEVITKKLEANRPKIVALGHTESRLPTARLEGELTRTISQFHNFRADILANRWTTETVTEAMPDRAPLPRPRLVRKVIPIGPIVVFGASNFPLAFSVAGGDTASALAVRCPVIAKVHPAHPQLSKLIGSILVESTNETGLHPGVFQFSELTDQEAQELVSNQHVKGVGFTGSQRVGRILMDVAAARPDPIPVFAEMGSINPVFVFPGGEGSFSSGYIGSLTLGAGQFCTNPGVVFGVESEAWTTAKNHLKREIASVPSAPMLTDQIYNDFLSKSKAVTGEHQVCGDPSYAHFIEVDAREFILNQALSHEVFGPFAVIVTARDESTFEDFIQILEGQLTASVFGAKRDHLSLLRSLEKKVGRIVFNGFPTGVEVCDAMTHGGPFPASSDPRFTSVGNFAVMRWLRPLTLQNAPDWA
jgi:2,5-dioxopentanoate dehydrogenase